MPTLTGGQVHRFRSTRYVFGIPPGMDAELEVTDDVMRGIQLGLLLPQNEDGTFPAEPPRTKRGCGCGK